MALRAAWQHHLRQGGAKYGIVCSEYGLLNCPDLLKRLCNGGAEPFRFNLEKKKRKLWGKKIQRADRVQWPSFLQAGMLVSGCHTGHSTSTDFRAARADWWVGGQMEGGCTAQPSSASFPLLAHSLTSHLFPVYSFIYSANTSFFFALTLCATRHFTVICACSFEY